MSRIEYFICTAGLLSLALLAYFALNLELLRKPLKPANSQNVLIASPPPSTSVLPSDPLLSFINLPAGFSITYFAKNVPGARSLSLGKDNTVYVGTRNQGVVYALVDNNHDYQADEVITLAKKLNSPNGVAYHNGELYVAENTQIIKFANIDTTLRNNPSYQVISSVYPNQSLHGWKFIAIGPDNKLYVPVGAPCNICRPSTNLSQTMTRMNLDGSNLEVFARGIRNSVGFDWDKRTNNLWFTDNGQDDLGDNLPPDELNYAPTALLNFGFPYCYGNNIPDPDFSGQNCTGYTPPAIELGPHVAALGMRFYTGTKFPSEYQNKIFIAEHGSSSRSVPLGYRISMVTVENNQASNYQVFADGWLQGTQVKGRPVDVLVMDDGSLLVSDDYVGAVYRIDY